MTFWKRKKWGHFGIDLGLFKAKSAKKRPKSGSFSYRSFNYVVLYGVHSLMVT